MSSPGSVPHGRPPAAHVQAACARTQRVAVQPTMARQPAPHVQAAIAATAQPRIAGPGPAPVPAPHVQAAIARVQGPVPPAPTVQAKPAAPPLARPAPHVERATAAVQAKPSGLPPSAAVLQPGRNKSTKRQREGEEYPEIRDNRDIKRKRRRSSRLEGREVDYQKGERKLDEMIARAERKDQKEGEKKLKANLKKYEDALKKKQHLPRDRERSISYVKSRQNPETVSSLPISKDLMVGSYGEAKAKLLEPTFFFVSAPTQEGPSLEQHFVLRQGHDYVLFPLLPNPKQRTYSQEGNVGPEFVYLAETAESAAQWLKGHHMDYKRKKLKVARGRVARDINRMAGGLEPRISYPLEYLVGATGLTSFAAVIRADKGRVSKATRYIESILKAGGTSFSERFGGEEPTYVGTGEGTNRGPSGLRLKGEEDPHSESEYSSEDL